MLLTVGTWNLRDGGVDDGNDARLRRQLDVMASRGDADLWVLQEAKGWDANGRRLLHWAADRLGMSARFLIASNHHGCDLAMLVREESGVRVVAEHHDRASPWWHALGHLELCVAGVELHVLNVHLAPSSPCVREAEAEVLGLFRKRWVIAGGDFNAVPAGSLPRLDGVSEGDKVHRKLDQRAANAIQRAGFHDVGVVMGDSSPTVGHVTPGALAYRCDRIESTLPPRTYRAFEVVPIYQQPHAGPNLGVLSDHCPVLARFAIDGAVLGRAA